MAPPNGRPRPHQPTTRLHGDRGDVTTVAAVTVILLAIFTLTVQVALAWHAKTVVSGATADALQAAQVDGGSEADGLAAAERTLAGSRERLLTDVAVDVERGTDTTTVTIVAHIHRVFPLTSNTITVVATGPTERFRSSSEAP